MYKASFLAHAISMHLVFGPVNGTMRARRFNISNSLTEEITGFIAINYYVVTHATKQSCLVAKVGMACVYPRCMHAW